jgi:hypothetical protein
MFSAMNIIDWDLYATQMSDANVRIAAPAKKRILL